MKYPNLRAEMARHGLENKDFAITLNVTLRTIQSKFNGKTKSGFYSDEMIKIRDAHFPKLTLDYLFDDAEDSDVA